jgi:hypothetical protein
MASVVARFLPPNAAKRETLTAKTKDANGVSVLQQLRSIRLHSRRFALKLPR